MFAKVNSFDMRPCADPDGGGAGGSGSTEKSPRYIKNTGPDPLKYHKATKPEFNVGPSSAFHRFAKGPMIACF